ncbi:hypothetical protein [Tepidibacillus marianensis]|uniref:hypothetical protein n=1 Tax=Tepidibacillus marianensis TaxID=3131995 RepID=UPI0030D13236
MTIDQLIIIGFAIIISLIIGIFLGYRFGKNLEQSGMKVNLIPKEKNENTPLELYDKSL